MLKIPEFIRYYLDFRWIYESAARPSTAPTLVQHPAVVQFQMARNRI